MYPHPDHTPTGPIYGLVPDTMVLPAAAPATQVMPFIKPLPVHMSWAMAELRPHLELMAARFRDLMAELDRVGAALADLKVQFDIEAERGLTL